MKNTIAYQLAKGNITHVQANEILNTLFEYVQDHQGTSIFYGDLSPIARQGVEMLSIVAPKDFEATSIMFDGIEFIKTSNKGIWKLHAMTIPYGFEGNSFQSEPDYKTIKFPFDFEKPSDGAPF